MKTWNAAGGNVFCVLAGLALIAWAAGPAAGAPGSTHSHPGAGIAGCEVTVPTGDYALVTLNVDLAGSPRGGPAKWTYLGGLRAGKMRVDDGIGLREPGGFLELKGGKLTGSFRRVDLGAQVTIDATVSNGAISGSAQVGDKKAAVTGTVVPEAELARRNAVAKDKSWPAAQGPAGNGCAAQATGAATIDDVKDIRLVWRCEESDVGRGMGNIDRFMVTWGSATSRRTGSGCASPLVDEGRLFFKYFVPAPRDPKTPEAPLPSYGGTETSAAAAMLQEAKKAGYTGAQLPPYAHEKVFQCSDDIVLCMDAATGKTLWKAVMKGRGINHQHHKAGPFDMSPAYGNGKVFALGMSGWLYAFDAANGKPLWETKSELDYSNALLVSNGVVVAPAEGQWGGYDVNTGKLIWKAGGGRSVSTLSLWANGNDAYLIGRMGAEHAPAGVACLEARTGKEVWRLPIHVITGGRGLGPGGITIAGDRMLVYQNNGGGKKGDPLLPVLAAYKLAPSKPEPLWELRNGTAGADRVDTNMMECVHGESVPVVVRGKYTFAPSLQVVDLANGKVLGQSKGPRPANGGYMQVIEDLVLVRQDGTHGEHAQFGFHKVAENGGVRSLIETDWKPPVGGATSSYHHPVFYPLVDGRMFLRQSDGIYCWDVRKNGNGK